MGGRGGGPQEVSQAEGDGQGATDRQADRRGLQVHLRQLRDEVRDSSRAEGPRGKAQPGVLGENDL